MPLLNTQLMDELTLLADKLRQSTVQVRGRRGGMGSGVIWQPDGLIVTNDHVVRGSQVEVELADGQVLAASVERRNERRDLASLRVSTTGLPALAVGDARSLQVGELVLAMGNPLGMVGALTTGIVHAVPQNDGALDWVQADVRLAPGNSGGPLVNARCQVIGINSMIVNGLAIAIPSHVVERFLRGGYARPRLGVTLQPVLVRLEGNRRLALLVLEVAPDSLAEGRFLPGDVLIGVGGRGLRSPEDLSAALSNKAPGESLSIDYLRGGNRRSMVLELPGDPAGDRGQSL